MAGQRPENARTQSGQNVRKVPKGAKNFKRVIIGFYLNDRIDNDYFPLRTSRLFLYKNPRILKMMF